MVRISYRTSTGIYGPKEYTLPKNSRDVEIQLKRCRLREHSLKKCISVLLVVVVFCMCCLIVGLLSTCEGEIDTEKLAVKINSTKLNEKKINITVNKSSTEPAEFTSKPTNFSTLTVEISTATSIQEVEMTLSSELNSSEDNTVTTYVPEVSEEAKLENNEANTMSIKTSTLNNTEDNTATSVSEVSENAELESNEVKPMLTETIILNSTEDNTATSVSEVSENAELESNEAKPMFIETLILNNTEDNTATSVSEVSENDERESNEAKMMSMETSTLNYIEDNTVTTSVSEVSENSELEKNETKAMSIEASMIQITNNRGRSLSDDSNYEIRTSDDQIKSYRKFEACLPVDRPASLNILEQASESNQISIAVTHIAESSENKLELKGPVSVTKSPRLRILPLLEKSLS